MPVPIALDALWLVQLVHGLVLVNLFNQSELEETHTVDSDGFEAATTILQPSQQGSPNGERAERRSVTGGALPLVLRLGAALEAQNVVYCQWKGNWKRDRWARGEGDIDLLVARADVERFVHVLGELGFKEVWPPVERSIPGVTSYFGFDRELTQFVHVHAHYQLVFGHYLTANYHLPIEKPLLESAIPGHVFQVPAPEFDWIVFVIRALLGYHVCAGSGQWATWLSSIQGEFEYLKSRIKTGAVNAALEQHLPLIDPVFFATCVRAIESGCPLWTRLAVIRRLHRRLRSHARRSAVVDALWRFLARGAGWIRRSICAQSSSGRLAAGGRMIALVGGDGAGKSTAVEELYAWLSPHFATKRVHLGKPPRSLLTITVAAARRLALVGKRTLSLVHLHRSQTTPSDSPAFAGYLLLLRSVCVAYDRYRLYVKARRFATNGGLVVCDRFPVPQITAMDGPNIAQKLSACERRGLAALLLKAEAWFYRQILPPDLLLVLRVEPEVAARRKTDEDAAYVRARSRAVWEVDWEGTSAQVLDAGQPVAEVLSDLKVITWAEL